MKKLLILLFMISIILTATSCILFFEPPTPSFSVFSSYDSLIVSWEETPRTDSYHIYYSQTGSSEQRNEITANHDENRITIPYLENNQSYTVWMAAENSSGLSSISSPKSVTTDKYLWTIMVWMAGDNNLSYEAYKDIKEMEYGLSKGNYIDPSFSDMIQTVVQIDTNSNYDSNQFNNGSRVLVKADSDEFGPIKSEEVLSIDEPNMADANELKDFIQYTKANHPAHRYALIIWNHGDGVRSLPRSTEISTRAVAIDENNIEDEFTNNMLYTGEISNILSDNESVDFLGFDACYMGFFEIAYQYRPRSGSFSADTVTFSPDSEQIEGWEYDLFFEKLAASSLETVNSQDFATKASQTYQEAWNHYQDQTMTAIDNTEIVSLQETLNELGTTLANEDDLKALKTLQDYPNSSNVLTYFNNSNYGWRFHSGFDLYDLASKIAASSNFSSTARGAAESVKSKTDAAVLHSWGGDIFTDQGFQAGKNGLSLFFPAGYAEYNSYTFWDYQYFYTSNDHTDLRDWYSDTFSGDPDDMEGYGGIDFCDGDEDGTVETWFEMLQYWFNPDRSTEIHPGPMW